MRSTTDHHPSPFHTSSYSSAADNCVEVSEGPTGAEIRDTKHRQLSTLFFNASEWQALLGTARHDVD